MSANAWLTKFSAVFNNDDRDSIEELFQIDGFWRDYLPFGGTLQTLEGRDKIGQFAKEAGLTTTIEKITFEGGASDSEGFFHFETSQGLGRGICSYFRWIVRDFIYPTRQLKRKNNSS
jgi:hypothetical protein